MKNDNSWVRMKMFKSAIFQIIQTCAQTARGIFNNISVVFGGRVIQQLVGIPIGTN
jgi:hypothetical protein